MSKIRVVSGVLGDVADSYVSYDAYKQLEETLTEYDEAVRWIIDDSMYKAPEQVTIECRAWLHRLMALKPIGDINGHA